MVNVVIANYNGAKFLEPCLTSLQNQSYRDFRLTVVDNGSTDRSVEIVRGMWPQAKVVCLGKNEGFARANNIGAIAQDSEYVFLVNNDTEVAPDCLATLAAAGRLYPAYAIFAPKMLRFRDRGRIDNKGIYLSRSLRCRQIDSGKLDGPPDSPMEVFGASGGAAFIRRSVIKDIGLFDERFFCYQEDCDFAIRARQAGYRCLYVPRAVVYHYGNGTSEKFADFQAYFNHRNMTWVIRKNIPFKTRLKYGLGYAAYCFWRSIKVSLKGAPVAIIRAQVDGLFARGLGRTESLWRISSKAFEGMIGRRVLGGCHSEEY